MTTLQTSRRCAAVLLTALAAFAFSVQAQTVKRVQFQKGQTAASFKGRLPTGYGDYQAYVLRARKGQTLSVKLITDDPEASITIYETKELGPDEDAITTDTPHLRVWSGKLPITSEYSMQVYGPDDFGKKGTGKVYTLEISIK